MYNFRLVIQINPSETKFPTSGWFCQIHQIAIKICQKWLENRQKTLTLKTSSLKLTIRSGGIFTKPRIIGLVAPDISKTFGFHKALLTYHIKTICNAFTGI